MPLSEVPPVTQTTTQTKNGETETETKTYNCAIFTAGAAGRPHNAFGVLVDGIAAVMPRQDRPSTYEQISDEKSSEAGGS